MHPFFLVPVAVAAAALGLTPSAGPGAVLPGSHAEIAGPVPAAAADTVQLPEGWPAAFPDVPEGGTLAGVTEIPRERRRGDHAGAYFIVAVNLPYTEAESFRHYRQALEAADWEIVEALTNDGSRPGLVTIGFRGHGHAGDIRFQEVMGMVLATIHIYEASAGLASPSSSAGARTSPK